MSGGSETFTVDPSALLMMAQGLRLAAAEANTGREDLQRAAVEPVLGLPGDSDLYRSYVFAWGRWSAMVDLTYASSMSLASALEAAAGVYAAADEAASPTPGTLR